MILKMRIMYIRRYTHIHRDMWRGTQKFAELKKKYLKYSYKFECSVTFKAPPPPPPPPRDWIQWSQRRFQCWKRCLKPATYMLSRAAGDSRSTSATSTKRLPSGEKRNGGCTPPTLSSLDYALCDSFLLPRMNQDLKGRRLVDVA